MSKIRHRRTKASIFFSLSVLLSVYFQTAKADVVCSHCNVILISLDTVAASHVGVYNGKSKNTPNIDAFAQTARVYRDVHAPAPWTLPSHAAMLTGRFPWVLGIVGEDHKLPEETPTLAQLLKSHGYQTAAFVGGGWVSKRMGFERGFDHFYEPSAKDVDRNQRALFEKSGKWAFKWVAPSWRDARTGVDRSLKWIDKHRQKPFFLFLHSYDAHPPLVPSRESLEVLGIDRNKHDAVMGDQLLGLITGSTKMSPSELTHLSDLYDAGIFDLDREIGRFLNGLAQRNLDKNTIVIITSDHGEEYGEHGHWALHRTSLYEEQLRVPLLIRIPEKSSKILSAPVSLVDIVPTVLVELGIPLPAGGIDGEILPEIDTETSRKRAIFAQAQYGIDDTELAKTIVNLLKNQPQTFRTIRFTPPDSVNRFTPPGQAMVLVGGYKLIANYVQQDFTMFNLHQDSGEKENIIAKNPEIANDLKSKLIFTK